MDGIESTGAPLYSWCAQSYHVTGITGNHSVGLRSSADDNDNIDWPITFSDYLHWMWMSAAWWWIYFTALSAVITVIWCSSRIWRLIKLTTISLRFVQNNVNRYFTFGGLHWWNWHISLDYIFLHFLILMRLLCRWWHIFIIFFWKVFLWPLSTTEENVIFIIPFMKCTEENNLE